MKQHSQRIEEEHNIIGIDSSIEPLCTELSIDNGVWLEMEHNARVHEISQKVCKKALVSLNITPEDYEPECSFAPYCKNDSV